MTAALAFWALAACRPDAPAPPAPAPTSAPAAAGAPGPPPAAPAAPERPLLFADVTGDAGLDFRQRTGATGTRYYPEPHAGGCAAFDADGDGLTDLYAVDGGALPDPATGPRGNVLFRNAGGGRFVRAAAGPPGTGYGFGAYPADYDGDGDTDLFVTQLGPDALYRNRGDGAFDEVARAAGVASDGWSTGAAWWDYDGDGDLDLYVVHYVRYDLARPKRCWRNGVHYHGSPYDFEAEPDRLFRNRGDGTFEEVTRLLPTGGRSGAGKGLGALAWDLDDDGRAELYVANDETPNHLYKADAAGVIAEVGLLFGVAVNASGAVQAGMGLDAGDLDGDGRTDLVVTNFQGEWNNDFRQLAPGVFADVGERTGFGPPGGPYVGFGVVLLDADLDGDLDAFIANGHVWDNVAAIDEGVTYGQRNLLLRNDGRGGFSDVSDAGGPPFAPARLEVSRGTCLLDHDGDGDEDVFYVNLDAPAVLLRNDSPPPGAAWIGLRPAPFEGARVSVTPALTPGGRQAWRIRGYLSASEDVVRFALPPGAARVTARVAWPGGRSVVGADLAPGRVYRVTASRFDAE